MTQHARPAHSSSPAGAPSGAPQVQRQVVNFAFFKLAPAIRSLSLQEKADLRQEFLAAVTPRVGGMLCLTYSTVGIRPDADLMLWRISLTPDDFQSQTAAINKTRFAGYLQTTYSYLSMTKRSMYIDQLDPFHTAESRTHIIPGKRKYIFVYPFVKTRDWYLLPLEKRQEIMNEHIRGGNKYPSVKLNTTYSFGLDDQDFVVAFETNEPSDFLDLVQELRESEGSRYTERDTPIFTAVQTPVRDLIKQLADV